MVEKMVYISIGKPNALPPLLSFVTSSNCCVMANPERWFVYASVEYRKPRRPPLLACPFVCLSVLRVCPMYG